MFVDKLNNQIRAGDILKFDNDALYIVYFYENRFVIQNITKYSLPLKLDCFAKHNKIEAIRINDINHLD